MELIEKEKAIGELMQQADAMKSWSDRYADERKGILTAIRIIEIVPKVDAQPVRHGKWIHGREVCREYIGITLVSVQYEHWKCSACGYRTEGEPLWKYCPNCGAKMDERKEE